MIKLTDQEMIDDIMDWFDFEKVHKTMIALNWEWSSCGGIPELGQIKAVARARLKEAMEKGQSITGGFEAVYADDFLSLNFIVSGWDVHRDRSM